MDIMQFFALFIGLSFTTAALLWVLILLIQKAFRIWSRK